MPDIGNGRAGRADVVIVQGGSAGLQSGEVHGTPTLFINGVVHRGGR